MDHPDPPVNVAVGAVGLIAAVAIVTTALLFDQDQPAAAWVSLIAGLFLGACLLGMVASTSKADRDQL